MADNRKFVQAQSFTLAGSGVLATDTSITLQSFTLIDGTALTMTDFGALGYLVLEPGTSKEETISFAGITQNADGSATLTTVTRGLKFNDDYTADTSLRQAHSGGSIAIISNPAAFYAEFLNKNNDETILGTYTFTSTAIAQYDASPTFTTDNQIINKKYADDLAIAGVADANTTTKGIFEEATEAEINAATAAGGTAARLAINPSTLATSNYGTRLPSADEKAALVGTSGTAVSVSNKLVDADDVSDAAASGKIVRSIGTSLPALSAQNLTDIPGAKDSQNAGETINGATLPVAVYFNNTDDEWYACDANDDTKLEFLGFAISNSTNGNPIDIQLDGIVSGFSGLTVGARYYVQDDQTLGTSIGTYEVYVGVALSATEIVIDRGARGSWQYMGSATEAAGSITVPADARFAIIAMEAVTSIPTTARSTVTIARVGITSAEHRESVGTGDEVSLIASWSGSTITFTSAGFGITISSDTATAYFYR